MLYLNLTVTNGYTELNKLNLYRMLYLNMTASNKDISTYFIEPIQNVVFKYILICLVNI